MPASSPSTIGVFTSGGDAPGMNACIRAVVRTALFRALRTVGILRGYQGMIEGEFTEMTASSVSNTLQRGGTILKTSRSEDYFTKEGRDRAFAHLCDAGIEALVPIGGDGTFRGAIEFHQEHHIPLVGCPGTIDNDLWGTDFTIGFDTAVETALDAVDRIRDTAASHERIFLVEVMGRQAGFIALQVGLSGGAEEILLPETQTDIGEMCQRLMAGRRRGKTSSIVIVAEGEQEGGAFQVAQKIRSLTGLQCRVCVLGHLQRGGSPSADDRVLASRLGAGAVDGLLAGYNCHMCGEVNGQIVYSPLADAVGKKKPLSERDQELARVLAT